MISTPEIPPKIPITKTDDKSATTARIHHKKLKVSRQPPHWAIWPKQESARHDDDANVAVDDHTAALNARVTDAWKKASEQTVAAFQELAPQIQVTNKYGPNGLVDPDEVATALKIYRGRMQQANLLKSDNAPGFGFDAAAAEAKRDLKEHLTKAAQKDTPPAGGPLL